MSFSFTPQAVRKIQSICADRGGDLAVRIEIHKALKGTEWRMTLEPDTTPSRDRIVVNSIPVHVDAKTLQYLDGLMIDWVMTPDGPGFGVYDRNLNIPSTNP